MTLNVPDLCLDLNSILLRPVPLMHSDFAMNRDRSDCYMAVLMSVKEAAYGGFGLRGSELPGPSCVKALSSAAVSDDKDLLCFAFSR